MPFRVVIPRGRPLTSYLTLSGWETARDALRLLASDPRPYWAHQEPTAWRIYLPPRGEEWVLYTVADENELVTVIGAGRRTA